MIELITALQGHILPPRWEGGLEPSWSLNHRWAVDRRGRVDAMGTRCWEILWWEVAWEIWRAK